MKTKNKLFEVLSGREYGYQLPDSNNWVVVRYIEIHDIPINHVGYSKYNDKIVIFISSHPTKGSADKALRKLKQSEPIQLPKEEYNTYQLILSERQAITLVSALDLYSRIGMGQIEEIVQILKLNPGVLDENNSCKPTRLEAITELAKEAAECWMGRSGGYNGIFSEKIHDVFRISWDLQQVIRHRIAWDRKPTGGLQVDFDEPLKSSNEPLASIKLQRLDII